jgi:CheY-like chemotaxis protein
MRAGLRVLVVDDEILPAMLMRMQLSSAGLVVTEIVPSGEMAIARAREGRPDLIVMDVQLAGAMDGIEAAEAIRREASIPFIFLTGYDDRATQERARALEPLAYLVKPIDVAQVKSIIAASFPE